MANHRARESCPLWQVASLFPEKTLSLAKSPLWPRRHLGNIAFLSKVTLLSDVARLRKIAILGEVAILG